MAKTLGIARRCFTPLSGEICRNTDLIYSSPQFLAKRLTPGNHPCDSDVALSTISPTSSIRPKKQRKLLICGGRDQKVGTTEGLCKLPLRVCVDDPRRWLSREFELELLE